MDDVTETPAPGDVAEPDKEHLTPDEVLEKLDSLVGRRQIATADH